MNILFDRLTHEVTGLNRPALPFEYSVHLPYDIQATKSVLDRTEQLQKVNENGELLYYAPDGTETTLAIWIIEAAEETAESPAVEYAEIPLEPVMITKEHYRSVTYAEDPYAFTYEEIVTAKQQAIQNNSLRKLVYYDEDFPTGSFSTDLQSFSANMGDGILALHPGGQARTEKIALGTAAKTIQLYLEIAPDIKVEVGATASSFTEVIDGIVQLPEPTDELYVRFTNTTDRYRDVYAYGILI